MSSCYPREQLARFLADELSDEEEQSLVTHVETCPLCPEALRHLVGRDHSFVGIALPSTTDESGPELASDFLNSLKEAPPSSSPRAADEGSGLPWPTIPGYEILAFLGRGGMGTVYRARHLQLKREVALKLLLPGKSNLDEAAEVTRFRTEAEAIARLGHPGIVQIHDIGEHQGQLYLALEFCPGGSLDARLGGTPLLTLAAARVVEQLACAMHHAHTHGIVHRDLKPANVLLVEGSDTVLEDCHLRITDFGLAKKLEDSAGLTPQGVLLGTPSYMAPEQISSADSGLGPSADVYALGGILYELLTGRPPFKGANDFDTLCQVRHHDPVPPRQLQPQVPRDLETICLKCLLKDPRKRYSNAHALAEDLHRFLDHKPILARPTPLWERSGKWCRRHPARAALLATVLTVMLGSLAGALYIYQVNVHLKVARQEAIENFTLAKSAVDDTVTKIAENQRLQDHGFFDLRKDLLSSGVRFYAQLVKLKSADPAVEEDRIHAYAKLTNLRYLVGDREQAIRDFQEMQAVYTRLARDRPTVPVYRYGLAYSYQGLFAVLSELGRRDEAKLAHAQGQRLTEELVTDFPNKADHHELLVLIYMGWGSLLAEEGHRQEALQVTHQALAVQERMDALFPPSPVARARMVGLCNNLIAWHGDQGEPAEAEHAYQRARQICEELINQFPTNPEYRQALADSYQNLGYALYTQEGRLNDARAALQEALDIRSQLAAEFAQLPKYRQALAHSYHNFGAWLLRRGQKAEGEKLCRQALTILEKLAADFPAVPIHAEELGEGYLILGALMGDKENHEASLPWYGKAIATLEAVLAHDPQRARARQYLSNAYRGRGHSLSFLKRYTPALRAVDRAIELDNGENLKQLQIGRWGVLFFVRQQMVPSLQLARQGKHAQAVAAAESLLEDEDVHGETLYNAACVYAICSVAAKEEALLSEQYAARAVELLRKAHAAGLFKDPALLKQLKTDHDIDPLRERADYKKLVEGLADQGDK